MPRVESTAVINAPLDIVWNLAQDVEKLPEIMPDLVKVQILEQEQMSPVTTRVVTEWLGRIKQFNRNMSWTEEDVWNHENHTCHFWQIRGDFTDYRGDYTFTPKDGKTEVHLVVDYTFEIPLLGAIIKNVLQKLMQSNSDGMLKAMTEEAERRAGQASMGG
jgi:ribosome-associated toxin RatA of RatAB toxin-antitoxin module